MHPLCAMALYHLVARAPPLAWQVAMGAQLEAIGTSLADTLPERQLPWQGGGWTTIHQMLSRAQQACPLVCRLSSGNVSSDEAA